MKNLYKPALQFCFITSFYLLWHPLLKAQLCASMNIELTAEVASDCAHISMTMLHDRSGRDYLYVANKEGGLRIYDIQDAASPLPVDTIGTAALGGLQVMSLSQNGQYLYLALGNFFANDQPPGMAIVDVSQAEMPVLKDVWQFSVPTSGAGIVKVQGDYAYLGAMQHGLIILNIADPNDITFVSQFVPDINYPDPNPDPAKFNARGMAVRDDVVYLCYDAGGLRIINVSNKTKPRETGRYALPELNNRPRAYNNLVLDGELAYIAIDYCGLEILNVGDTTNIQQVSWWNPWDCTSSPLAWFSSLGHTNEIVMDKENDLLFMSTGKSDLHVVDVRDASAPDSCSLYGGVDNNIGTWGVDVYEDQLFLSYICAVIPFSSNWTGVKMLQYHRPVAAVEVHREGAIQLWPNPVDELLHLQLRAGMRGQIRVLDSQGRVVEAAREISGNARLDTSHWPAGLYVYQFENWDGQQFFGKLLRI